MSINIEKLTEELVEELSKRWNLVGIFIDISRTFYAVIDAEKDLNTEIDLEYGKGKRINICLISLYNPSLPESIRISRIIYDKDGVLKIEKKFANKEFRNTMLK
jgi:hypothetical protein